MGAEVHHPNELQHLFPLDKSMKKGKTGLIS